MRVLPEMTSAQFTRTGSGQIPDLRVTIEPALLIGRPQHPAASALHPSGVSHPPRSAGRRSRTSKSRFVVNRNAERRFKVNEHLRPLTGQYLESGDAKRVARGAVIRHLQKRVLLLDLNRSAACFRSVASPVSGRAGARCERCERQNETNQQLHARVNAPELQGLPGSENRAPKVGRDDGGSQRQGCWRWIADSSVGMPKPCYSVPG
jgi:hypothetical protein